uniref:Tryptophan 2,3-dioxygenase n=1 Tax=Candidatus Kentrum sp. LFY TaxID=2126342 RepID=A0A450WTB5_9GAMM|nr:MAG: protein of unknown function (DUF1864) [Candidatus Kentron sp. LFY]
MTRESTDFYGKMENPFHRFIDSTEKTSLLDPFSLDDFFLNEFHRINHDGSAGDLIAKVNDLGLLALRFQNISRITACAMVRDLCFLASSLVRHGVDIREASGLEQALIGLSRITREVPRDNVYTYSMRNPKGKRRRSFTGSSEELLFIELLDDSNEEILKLLSIFPGGEEFDVESLECANTLQMCAGGLRVLISSTLSVRKRIPPEVFSGEIRPFFDPLYIGGRSWVGHSAAQMPLLLIDWALWGCDCTDDAYREYFRHNMEYSPAIIRDCSKWKGLVKSYVSVLERAARQGPLSSAARANATALLKVLNELVKFRYPHIKVAEENFRIRGGKIGGSGGYDMGILYRLAEHTQNNRIRIKTVLKT